MVFIAFWPQIVLIFVDVTKASLSLIDVTKASVQLTPCKTDPRSTTEHKDGQMGSNILLRLAGLVGT